MNLIELDQIEQWEKETKDIVFNRENRFKCFDQTFNHANYKSPCLLNKNS